MYYINFLILCLLLLSGCAGTPQHVTSHPAENLNGATQADVKAEIALYGKAINYLNDNKLDNAKAILLEITSKRPELAGPWANLAIVNIKQNNLDQAQKNLEQALSRDPALPQAYNLLGYIAKQNGNINQAVKYYLMAIDKKPDYAIAHYNVALLYDTYLQDIPKAINHYKQYLEITHDKDKQTATWVTELENSLKRGAL